MTIGLWIIIFRAAMSTVNNGVLAVFGWILSLSLLYHDLSLLKFNGGKALLVKIFKEPGRISNLITNRIIQLRQIPTNEADEASGPIKSSLPHSGPITLEVLLKTDWHPEVRRQV